MIIILSLCCESSAQYQPSSCFATCKLHYNLNQTVLWGNTSSTIKPPTNPQSTGYPFTLAWGNTYPNLTSSSYAISGVKMGEPNKPLSLTAILNANPTGGTFTYIPDSVSSIIYTAFSIILVSSCSSGTVYMERLVYSILFSSYSRHPQQFNSICIYGVI